TTRLTGRLAARDGAQERSYGLHGSQLIPASIQVVRLLCLKSHNFAFIETQPWTVAFALRLGAECARSSPRAFRTTMKQSVGIMDNTLREFRFDRRCAPDIKNMSANLVISSAADVSSP